MQYGGTNLSPMGGNTLNTAGTSTTTSSAAGYNIGATVATTGIEIWSSLAQASQTNQMQKDLAAYNNSMRAIMQSTKQFAADLNRSNANDAKTQESQQIEIDRMRAEAQLTTQAAFTGASSSAKRAAMFDVDRNALTAKFNLDSRFESALQQIQLTEYSDEMQMLQQHQVAAPTGVTAGQAITAGIAGLADKSMKSGAWDKGSNLRTYFSDLFNNSSAKLPE